MKSNSNFNFGVKNEIVWYMTICERNEVKQIKLEKIKLKKYHICRFSRERDGGVTVV